MAFGQLVQLVLTDDQIDRPSILEQDLVEVRPDDESGGPTSGIQTERTHPSPHPLLLEELGRGLEVLGTLEGSEAGPLDEVLHLLVGRRCHGCHLFFFFLKPSPSRGASVDRYCMILAFLPHGLGLVSSLTVIFCPYLYHKIN